MKFKVGQKVKVKSLPDYPALTVVSRKKFDEPFPTNADRKSYKYKLKHVGASGWRDLVMIRHGDELRPADRTQLSGEELVGLTIKLLHTGDIYKVLEFIGTNIHGRDRYVLQMVKTGYEYNSQIADTAEVVG